MVMIATSSLDVDARSDAFKQDVLAGDIGNAGFDGAYLSCMLFQSGELL